MKALTGKEKIILEVLQNRELRGREIADVLDTSTHEVSRLVAKIRKKFNNGNENASYIYTTKNGYTLQETPDNLYYEGMMRLRRGTSMILNGKHVYNRCRAISLPNFEKLKIEFHPKAETIRTELTQRDEVTYEGN